MITLFHWQKPGENKTSYFHGIYMWESASRTSGLWVRKRKFFL